MTKENDPGIIAAKAVANRFGALSLTMLNDTPLSPVWRIAFVANFFTGPLYGVVLERFGVSRPGFVILFSLSHQDGLVARDICRVTGLPKNSISRAVTELEVKHLIARDTDSTDKRAKPLHLTQDGRDLLQEIV
ncbi:MAG: MarR family transcriptional regulator, partial [Pseudomonadota bacterium]